MTDIIKAAEKSLEGVTPGPWKVVKNINQTLNVIGGRDADGDTRKVCLVNGAEEANARFIAWAREGVPALIAETAALREEVARLRDALKLATTPRPAMEGPWQAYGGASSCGGFVNAKTWLTPEPLGHGVTDDDMAAAFKDAAP